MKSAHSIQAMKIWLEKKSVEMTNHFFKGSWLRCKKCDRTWGTWIENGKLPRAYWRCPDCCDNTEKKY